MPYAIETVSLTKHFTQSTITSLFTLSPKNKIVEAVKDVNIQIKGGELFALVGPNGAGKTTFLKILCTLILPTAGTAYINGRSIVKESKTVKKSIGLVTGEERSFYWRLTGRQNLGFFAALHDLSSQKAREKINELLSLLEIEEEADRIFKTYSTGIKQRMGIARGLLNDPQLLLIDDLTRSLDPNAARNLRIFIREKLVNEQKKTVLFTTHQLQEAEDFSDRIAIMDKGEIKACGTLTELKEKLRLPEASLDEIFAHLTGEH